MMLRILVGIHKKRTRRAGGESALGLPCTVWEVALGDDRDDLEVKPARPSKGRRIAFEAISDGESADTALRLTQARESSTPSVKVATQVG